MEHIAGNLFLVGLMGAGKTTQGKRLAQHLNRTFFDSDTTFISRFPSYVLLLNAQ